MSDENQTTDQSTSASETSIKAVTGALVGAVGAVNPIAGIAVGVAKEFADPYVVRAFDKIRSVREQRAINALSVGSNEAELPLDRMVHTIETNPELLNLMSETVQAAMQTPLASKIVALGKCLGRGVRDETTVDAEFIYVRGLAEIEAPEVKVMEVLDQPTKPAPQDYAQPSWPGWRRPEILDDLPGFTATLDASLARLTAAGMIKDDGIGRLPPDEDSEKEMWILTDFGKRCLSLLRAVSPSSP
ncbi:hypothetical protein ACFTY8_23100 [Streptomyces mirabilis]|uniref:hypothetical protein n=1 Tax=Streptomyces mirabilis TaxID=68239 RepID=UPI00364344B3